MRISDWSSDVCSSDLGDPLAGYPLQGVSKYNYTLGLLYEKYGISGRLVYTYRSKYFGGDNTGSPTLRPFTAENINDVYVPPRITYVRAAGRLDFNIGYDVPEELRLDVGGTNILHRNTNSTFDYPGHTKLNRKSH